MDTTVIAVIVLVVALAVLAGGAFAFVQRNKQSEHLQERFGPEYDRAVRSNGNRENAEKELSRREDRVEEFDIRDLSQDERSQFFTRWKQVQAEFVQAPATAILQADELVQKAMLAKGYPVADFDQRAADLSVNHAGVVENYRSAHAISEAHRQLPRPTEELRQAMIHYRALFEELLGEVSARN